MVRASLRGGQSRLFDTAINKHDAEALLLAVQASGLAVWDVDLRTGERRWADELCEMLGLPLDTQGTREIFGNQIHPEDRVRVETLYDACLHEGKRDYDAEFRIIRADDLRERWVRTRGRSNLSDAGEPLRFVGTLTDITEATLDRQALQQAEERLRLALQAGRMFAWERDLKTGIVTRSENAKDLIGLASGSASEFVNRVHPQDRDKAPTILTGMWGTDGNHNEVRYICPDGETLWLSARAVEVSHPGQPTRMVGVTFDITERKLAEQEAQRLANEDSLTSLPNRRQFQRRLEGALETAKQDGTSVSLLLLDLDDFKDVNDTLGHDSGDALLKQAADRLRGMLRECDTVARIGGDEFAILIVAPLKLDNAVRFAARVLDDLKRPFEYNGRELATKASIGVASFPDHDGTVPGLMKDADLALYRAKTEGRNRVIAYTPDMRVAMEDRVRIMDEVRQALSSAQIVPFYQPKVCLVSGRIVGFEALARWQHPSKGVLTPAYFGAAFDDGELAQMIGDVMIRQVALDVGSWLSAGHDCGRVAINLSSGEFGNPGLSERLLDTIRNAGVPTSNLEIEVTESVFLGPRSHFVKDTLIKLSLAGVRIALDDFGTGFASLTHLKQFPIDHIKIDQSFVRGLAESADDRAIVSAVVGLGRNLKMIVTAEGIETEQQAVLLRGIGCSFGQGYLYAKPMAGTRVPWFLGARRLRLSMSA